MSKLIVDKNYFSSKKGSVILPEQLDDYFNRITSYIKDILIPSIGTITFAKTNGVVGQTSSVFCNINNNEVGYMYLQDINIDNNLIPLSKLKKAVSGSVLGSDFQGDIYAIVPTANNQLLFGDYFDTMSWRHITSDDINDRIITGDHLGILENENFVTGAFNDIIWDDSISEHNLKDISNNKIAPQSVDFKHIGVFLDLPYNIDIAKQLKLDDFDDNSITKHKNSKFIPVNLPLVSLLMIPTLQYKLMQAISLTFK